MRHNSTPSSPSLHRPRFAISAFVLAGALTAGCQGADIDSDSHARPSEATLIADAMYMSQIFADNSNGEPFIRLDLSDDGQFQYVQDRLAHHGKNALNAPHLFERLDDIRARHQKARDNGEIVVKASGGGQLNCGAFPLMSGEVQGSVFTLTAHSVLTCRGNLDYLWNDMQLFETDEAESYLGMLASTWAEDFGVFDVTTPEIQGNITINGDKSIKVAGFAMASDWANGVDELIFTAKKTVADDPATITPYNLSGTGSGECDLDHPRDATGDGIVRMCYQRSFTVGVGDCDYAAVDAAGNPGVTPYTHIAMMENVGGTWVASATERWAIPGAPVNSVDNLFIPLQGSVDSGTSTNNNGQQCRILSIDSNQTEVSVSLNETGGWCNADPGGSGGDELSNNLQTNLVSLRTGNGANVFELPFGVDLSQNPEVDNTLLIDFGADCLENLQDVNLMIDVCFKSPSAGCADDNNPNTRCASCSMVFDVRNSCFAAGTGIRLADGRVIPVEQVKVGDQVVSNGDNRPLTVTGLTRGSESEPMVRILDNQGHELTLTAKHPVVTSIGLLAADQLTTQMQVETETGLATIVEVERIPYGGQVYNLNLGTDDELTMVAVEDVTMFAGGIRVGDNQQQFELERKSVRELGQRRAAASVWKADQAHANTGAALRDHVHTLRAHVARMLDW